MKILIFQILKINFTLNIICLKNKIHGYLMVKWSKIMIRIFKMMTFIGNMEKIARDGISCYMYLYDYQE